MTRSLTLALLSIVLCAGCTRLPESFPPPEQRAPLTVPLAGPLGYFVSMADPNADAYLVKDVADSGPGTWRWVYGHPVLRFFVPDVPRLKFAMDFAIPERTMRETGPVTLTFTVNGKLLDRLRCEKPGEQHYAHDVPPGMLRAGAINLVCLLYTSPSPRD